MSDTELNNDVDDSQVEGGVEEPTFSAADIVDAIFDDNRVATLQRATDVMQQKAFDAVQQKKVEFAGEWGFNLDQTAQAVADELTDELPDNTDIPGTEPEEQETEEPTDETYS